jgi:hypothetical protein
MMGVRLETVPHLNQRYNTVGDWYLDWAGELVIRVSQMGDPNMEMCVLLHEQIEAQICLLNGVTDEMVDRFDMAYEAARPEGDDSEPGDDPHSPYYRAHQTASAAERAIALALGVSWSDYEDKIASLTRIWNEEKE